MRQWGRSTILTSSPVIEKLEKRATEKANKISGQKLEFRGTSKSKMKVLKRGRPKKEKFSGNFSSSTKASKKNLQSVR